MDATVRIGKNIAKIKQRMQEHPGLQEAHHFCYDHRLEFRSARVDYVVMGINPGETEEDKRRHQAPPPGEETSEADFHLPHPSPARIRWFKNAEFYCHSRNIAFTNCFFWSSPKETDLRTRYSNALDEHFQFCAELNIDLINIHQPEAVVFAGISYTTKAPWVPRLYKLRGPNNVTTATGSNDRLVEVYDDGKRPWLFTRHWSSARIRSLDKPIIKQTILDVIKQWR